ncbi:MAG: hypothetical protein WAO95_08015 [Burkholderiales bacterium]
MTYDGPTLKDQPKSPRIREVRLGASVHIVKPIFRETLVAAVRQHLRQEPSS